VTSVRRVAHGMLIMLFASASARAECSHAAYEALRPPKYPAAAAAAHMEGRVLVSIIVHADGRATDAFVRRSSGHDELDLAALDAVSSWRYKPRNCNGKPAAEEVWVPIEFNLDESAREASSDVDGRASTGYRARGYTVERDEAPIAAPTARAMLQLLQQDPSFEEFPERVLDAVTTMRMYVQRRAHEAYEVFESSEGGWSVANGNSTFVLRMRYAGRGAKDALLYAVACDGPKDWCERTERQQVDFLVRNPPPPMPPAPDEQQGR